MFTNTSANPVTVFFNPCDEVCDVQEVARPFYNSKFLRSMLGFVGGTLASMAGWYYIMKPVAEDVNIGEGGIQGVGNTNGVPYKFDKDTLLRLGNSGIQKLCYFFERGSGFVGGALDKGAEYFEKNKPVNDDDSGSERIADNMIFDKQDWRSILKACYDTNKRNTRVFMGVAAGAMIVLPVILFVNAYLSNKKILKQCLNNSLRSRKVYTIEPGKVLYGHVFMPNTKDPQFSFINVPDNNKSDYSFIVS